jgi:hypothetical protein
MFAMTFPLKSYVLKSFVLAAAGALALGGTSARAELIVAKDMAPMVTMLKAKGLEADVRGGGSENPYIASDYGGYKFLVIFMNCDDKYANCKTVQFYMGFNDAKDVSLERLNAWNRDSRFARAYRDNEGDPVLEMDLDLDFKGLPRENVDESMNTWFSLMQAYRDFVFDETQAAPSGS